MTPEYLFNQLQLPSKWLFKGYNHVRNENDEIISFGKVYDDRESKIIRISFSMTSERVGITERTRSTNGKGPNYKTICDIRSQELDRINEFIFKTYTL